MKNIEIGAEPTIVVDRLHTHFGSLYNVRPRSFANPVTFDEAWLNDRLFEGLQSGSDGCDETIEQLTADYPSYGGFRIDGEKVGELFVPELTFYFDDQNDAEAFRGRWLIKAEGPANV